MNLGDFWWPGQIKANFRHRAVSRFQWKCFSECITAITFHFDGRCKVWLPWNLSVCTVFLFLYLKVTLQVSYIAPTSNVSCILVPFSSPSCCSRATWSCRPFIVTSLFSRGISETLLVRYCRISKWSPRNWKNLWLRKSRHENHNLLSYFNGTLFFHHTNHMTA